MLSDRDRKHCRRHREVGVDSGFVQYSADRLDQRGEWIRRHQMSITKLTDEVLLQQIKLLGMHKLLYSVFSLVFR